VIADIIWSILLVGSGCFGMWLATKTWVGWFVSFLSEAGWLLYAMLTHDKPLAVMACVYGIVNGRNTLTTRKAQR
jgi:hypothetical protein